MYNIDNSTFDIIAIINNNVSYDKKYSTTENIQYYHNRFKSNNIIEPEYLHGICEFTGDDNILTNRIIHINKIIPDCKSTSIYNEKCKYNKITLVINSNCNDESSFNYKSENAKSHIIYE